MVTPTLSGVVSLWLLSPATLYQTVYSPAFSPVEMVVPQFVPSVLYCIVPSAVVPALMSVCASPV